MDLPPVQMRVTREAGAPSAEAVHHAAQHGTSGTGEPLPFLDRIQRAFGRHDVRGVQAHTGAAAAEGTRGMGAEAYATGNAVAFGKAPDLHTAAHEAAHVVQQRAGVSLAGGVGRAGDSHEQHADAVADRVVAGGSAEALLDRYGGGGGASVGVQRKITRNGEPLPSTYGQLEDKTEADAVLADARANTTLHPAPTREELEGAWNRIARSNTRSFDVTSQRAELAAALVKSVKSSRDSSARAATRNAEAKPLIAPLLAENSDLRFAANPRNPMVRAQHMETFEPPATDEASKKNRAQTHISTVVLAAMGKGEEAQASLADDQGSVVISTNTNAVNDKLRQQVRSPDDLRAMSAEVARERGLADKGREDGMKDRVLRHAMKLFERLNEHLRADGVVSVPENVNATEDGLHAEIRIDKSAAYQGDPHNPPSGTKYPCAGCHLYFTDQGKTIGLEMGPMWVTAPALSTQVGGVKFSEIEDVNAVAQRIADQYRAAKANGARMGMGRPKTGKPKTATNADSESEYDSATFGEVKQRMLDHRSGGSASAPPGAASPVSDIASDASSDHDSSAEEAQETQGVTSSQIPEFGALTLGGGSHPHGEDSDGESSTASLAEPSASPARTGAKRKRPPDGRGPSAKHGRTESYDGDVEMG